MKVTAIIAEYNPFHNGHIYHLKKSKQISGADKTVVIMSGNFVQRGGPALIDKWRRSKLAIENGADLVIELPFVYASQTAEVFSSGAVGILNSMNCIDSISFGSETEKIDKLMSISKFLAEEPENYKSSLKQYLKEGFNFPKARNLAIEDCFGEYAPEIAEPNNILAIEYIKALFKLNSSIKPFNIVRYKSDHNSPMIMDDISSATSIRKSLFDSLDMNSNDNICSSISSSVPLNTVTSIEEFFSEYNDFNSFDKLLKYSFYKLITEKEDMGITNRIFDLNDDLYKRIINMLESGIDYPNILKELTSKNYTSTRIRRILTNIAIGVRETDINAVKECSPGYIRVLASNSNGFKILNEVKKKSNLKIINRFSDIKSIDSPTDRLILKYEKLSTDIYFFLLNRISLNMDYRTSPYIKK